jgi:hypothetical protein
MLVWSIDYVKRIERYFRIAGDMTPRAIPQRSGLSIGGAGAVPHDQTKRERKG